MIFVLIAIMALIWGFTFVGTSVLLETMMPVEILAVRWTIALLAFVILIAFKVVKVDFKGKPLKWLLLVATIQPTIYSILETWGLKLTTASESSLFTSLIPVMVIVEGVIFLKQKVNKRVLGAVILAFSGITVCVVFAPDFSVGSKMIGYIVLIMTVVVGGAYTHASNKASQYFSPFEVTFALAFEGALAFNIMSLVSGNGLSPFVECFTNTKYLGAILYLGLGGSCIAYLICTYALAKLSPMVASTIQTNAITVIGVFAGIAINHDKWGWYTIVGMLMAMIGIFITAWEGNKRLKAMES